VTNRQRHESTTVSPRRATIIRIPRPLWCHEVWRELACENQKMSRCLSKMPSSCWRQKRIRCSSLIRGSSHPRNSGPSAPPGRRLCAGTIKRETFSGNRPPIRRNIAVVFSTPCASLRKRFSRGKEIARKGLGRANTLVQISRLLISLRETCGKGEGDRDREKRGPTMLTGPGSVEGVEDSGWTAAAIT